MAIVYNIINPFLKKVIKRYGLKNIYYGPSIISVIVTEGHLRGSGLYRISKTIRRGVAKLYS